MSIPNAVATVGITVSPNPAPFSGAPITDLPQCTGNTNTWFYAETLAETAGVGVTITSIVDRVDGVIVNNATNTHDALQANGALIYTYRWCFGDSGGRTVQSTFSGTDANGHVISIAGPAVTLQPKPSSAPACGFALSATTHTLPANAGNYSVTVTRTLGDSSCSFSASTTAPFITLTGPTSGTTSPLDVSYSVPANTSPSSRTGVITINWNGGSAQVVVTQAGASSVPTCDFALSATTHTLPANAGNYSVTVTRTLGNSSCSFSASTTAPFITLTGPTSGNASPLDVPYSVPANATSSSRIGTITISWNGGSADVVVTQAASGS